MGHYPSHQRLSQAIGTIYDSAVDPRLWPAAIEEMCGLVGSFFGSITILDPGVQAFRFVSRWGGDPYWIDLLDAKYANLMPFIPVLDRFDVGQPFNLAMAADLLGDPNVWDGPFTTEWATPAGVRDAASAVLQRSAHRLATMSLATSVDRAAVSAEELAIIGLLAPHVRRALTISDLIDMKNLTVDTLDRVLDTIRIAAIAVDARCKVMHANAAASEMLSLGSPLIATGGTISAAGMPHATVTLHEAVSRAARDAATMPGAGVGVPLRFDDGRPAIAHVLPLQHGHLRQGAGIGAVAAIFIATPVTSQQAPVDAFAGLYGLTNAETKLLDQLAEGKNRGQAAAHLEIADSTAKTHLEHIFWKTGASTQSELVRLLSSLSAPVVPT